MHNNRKIKGVVDVLGEERCRQLQTLVNVDEFAPANS